jgi:hypothetical protein
MDDLLELEHAGWASLCDGTGSEFYGDVLSESGIMVLADGSVMTRDDVVWRCISRHRDPETHPASTSAPGRQVPSLCNRRDQVGIPAESSSGQDESSSVWIGAGNRTVKRVSPNSSSSTRAFAST